MTLKLFLLILVSTFAFSNCAKKEKDNGPLLASAAIIIQQQSGSTSYSIGGSITGLTTTGLVLQNNSGDDLTVAANATTFTFTTKVSGAYAVTVKTQPTGFVCTVSSGSGTASANVTNVSIACAANTYSIGGSITGLTTTG